MIDFAHFGIDTRGATGGNIKTVCPECAKEGTRHHPHDKSLSVNIDTGVFHCHYCGWKGVAVVNTDEERKEWMKQQPWYREHKKDKTVKLPPKTYKRPNGIGLPCGAAELKWFEKRGISKDTVEKMKITSGQVWFPEISARSNSVQYNYYKDGELVAAKYRGYTKDEDGKVRKIFAQPGGCEQLPYNLDGIKGKLECYIVEGEMDALALVEVGYDNVVSVPDGANQNLEWLERYYDDYFADKQNIYICSDSDTKGVALREALIQRFGVVVCKIVTEYGDGCKDADDCLMKYGADELRKRLAAANDIRPEGDVSSENLLNQVIDLKKNGLPKGIGIGLGEFDSLCRFRLGMLVIITGTPGGGKTEWIDQMIELTNIRHGWRWSVFSPEFYPISTHVASIIEKFTGKNFERMEWGEFMPAAQRTVDAVHFIDPRNFTLDEILDIAKYQVRKYGCNCVVIDPWNDVTLNGNEAKETDNINAALFKILTFAQRNNVVAFVMAHPAKLSKTKDGMPAKVTLGDISGSQHFYNRADVGIVVNRHTEEDYTEIEVQKMRFRYLGKIGSATYKYNKDCGRYAPYSLTTQEVTWDFENHIIKKIKEEEEKAQVELKTEQGPAGDNGLNFSDESECPY